MFLTQPAARRGAAAVSVSLTVGGGDLCALRSGSVAGRARESGPRESVRREKGGVVDASVSGFERTSLPIICHTVAV